LLFKQTDFEKGSVQVQLRFGEGLTGLSPSQPSLAWLSGLVGPSGLADLDLDAMERLLTGRRMSLAFGVDEDAFVLRGQTNEADLADQLRLLALKLAYPRFDEPLFARAKSGALESYDLSFASASARAGREFGGLSRRGDQRWAPVEKEKIANTTPGNSAPFSRRCWRPGGRSDHRRRHGRRGGDQGGGRDDRRAAGACAGADRCRRARRAAAGAEPHAEDLHAQWRS
jgi:zinc protease